MAERLPQAYLGQDFLDGKSLFRRQVRMYEGLEFYHSLAIQSSEVEVFLAWLLVPKPDGGVRSQAKECVEEDVLGGRVVLRHTSPKH